MQEINELNKKHAVVQYGGQTLVLNEERDEEGNLTVTFSTFPDFDNRYSNKFVGNKKLGKFWLEHADRRQYDGVVFNPNGAAKNFYNLWQGFRIKPKEGDCNLYLNHIYNVIASGNEELGDYILNFMADAIQNPGKKPGVALVLRGDQGVGKGQFVKWFSKLFEPHFAHVSDPSHFLGNFNSVLDSKLLIFADEAFWAGDKKAEGKLKTLVTEDDIHIERKYRDVRRQRNFVRLIVASNNDWVIPAMANERRFCVMDVSDIHRQDTKYFSELNDQMKNGGLEALMYLLLHRDISGVDLRKFPKTKALMDQKLNSMSAIESWWHDCLMRGYVNDGWDSSSKEWPASVSTVDAYNSYETSAKKRGIKNHLSQNQFGKELKQRLVPEVVKRRVTLLDAEMTAPSGFKNRGYAYDLPPLEECRSHFDKVMALETEWPEA